MSPPFSDGKDTIRYVCHKSFEPEREWRDTPPPTWSPACGWWEMKEIKTIILYAAEINNVAVKNLGETLVKW